MGRREKIRDIINKTQCECLNEGIAAHTGYLADEIEALLPQWISVKKELPEEGQIVLWWHSDDRMVEFGSAGSFNGENVTHWMPLPAPPINQTKEG